MPDARERPGAFQHAYCLYCKVGEEKKASQRLESETGYLALFPYWMKMEKRKSEWRKRSLPLLPGYIFLYTSEKKIFERDCFAAYPSVRRVLRYADGQAELQGEDLRFAQWVLKNRGILEVSTAAREGDHIAVVDGPLCDYQGRILLVNKQKQLAKVAIQIGGLEKQVWMSFNWVEKSNANEGTEEAR